MAVSRRFLQSGILLIVALSVGIEAGAQNPPVSDPPSSEGAVDRVELQCIPVAAYWNGSEPGPGTPPGPGLAVVTLDLRPKDAEVHLDGRFIGRSRYFNGKKGHLFLEPGSYVLELRLEGYRVVRIDLLASERCRYDLVHRLGRWRGEPQYTSSKDYGKGVPFNRVFAPRSADGSGGRQPSPPAGADLRLRSDLGSGRVPSSGPPPVGASLSLAVKPETAAVFVDGVFFATAQELSSMEGPAASTAGERVIEIRAKGFQTWSETLVLDPGEVKALTITLTPVRSAGD